MNMRAPYSHSAQSNKYLVSGISSVTSTATRRMFWGYSRQFYCYQDRHQKKNKGKEHYIVLEPDRLNLQTTAHGGKKTKPQTDCPRFSFDNASPALEWLNDSMERCPGVAAHAERSLSAPQGTLHAIPNEPCIPTYWHSSNALTHIRGMGHWPSRMWYFVTLTSPEDKCRDRSIQPVASSSFTFHPSVGRSTKRFLPVK
jgi:hypothetical protein